jgi:hypothetical protein
VRLGVKIGSRIQDKNRNPQSLLSRMTSSFLSRNKAVMEQFTTNKKSKIDTEKS